MANRASLTANVIANYIGQFYVAFVNLAFLPLQVSLLGAEGYGLVGFFAAVSAWLQLLDVGLSPTLARETASYRAGALTAAPYRQLLRSIDFVFFGLGAFAAAVMWALSDAIARRWLQAHALSPETMSSAIALMGAVFAFRWLATPTRSALLGLERQVLVNGVSAAAATLRSGGVVLALRWLGGTAPIFFRYQAAVAVLELLVLRVALARELSFGDQVPKPRWTIGPLKDVAPFSLRVATTGVIWVCTTQVDKLILSKVLPLAQYAHYSLAVTAASAVTLLGGPIGQAVQPRLTYSFAEGNEQRLSSTYSDATQVLSATAFAASFVIAAAGKALLWVWTGDVGLAQSTGGVLSYYALGNGLLALVTMTYYLQVAHGDLRMHLRGTIIFAAVVVPGISWAAVSGGMLSAAKAWFGANVMYFVFWTALVHRRFMPRRHGSWLVRDASLPGALALPVTFLLSRVDLFSMSRTKAALAMVAAGCLAVACSAVATAPARRLLRSLSSRVKAM